MTNESTDPLVVREDQVIRALMASGHSFSEFVGQSIEIECPSVKIGQLDSGYLDQDLEKAVVAACLAISGGLGGLMTLIFPFDSSCHLVDLLMGNELGTTDTLDEMGRSAIAEVGNIVGSSFLNALADEAGMKISISPPATTEDMAGAVMGSLYAEALARGDYAVIALAAFKEETGVIQGDILILPDPGSFRVVRA
jgi:chemotaxis protein CheC